MLYTSSQREVVDGSPRATSFISQANKCSTSPLGGCEAGKGGDGLPTSVSQSMMHSFAQKSNMRSARSWFHVFGKSAIAYQAFTKIGIQTISKSLGDQAIIHSKFCADQIESIFTEVAGKEAVVKTNISFIKSNGTSE